MQLFDTHCHIHFPDYELDPDEVRAAAEREGVTRLLCVGCTLRDSQLAVAYAARHDGVWASIGLHPHEGSVYVNDDHALQQFRSLATKPKVVAVGETGLDYYYNHSSKTDQQKLLRFQLDLAAEHGLPLIFHVRDAFEDFWRIFDEYKDLRGVVHSFSAGPAELEQILGRGLYVGLNGIMTFTKKPEQLKAAKKVPLDKLLIETDAPFLTPVPFRGRVCEPKHVRVTAEFLAHLRHETLQEFAAATTQNAKDLFSIP
jgi:TatD DNase family protein